MPLSRHRHRCRTDDTRRLDVVFYPDGARYSQGLGSQCYVVTDKTLVMGAEPGFIRGDDTSSA